jgi:hypothetical protein
MRRNMLAGLGYAVVAWQALRGFGSRDKKLIVSVGIEMTTCMATTELSRAVAARSRRQGKARGLGRSQRLTSKRKVDIKE